MKETNKENTIATYMNSSFQASKKYFVSFYTKTHYIS